MNFMQNDSETPVLFHSRETCPLYSSTKNKKICMRDCKALRNNVKCTVSKKNGNLLIKVNRGNEENRKSFC